MGEVLLVLFGRIFWKDSSHPKHPHHLKGSQVVFQLSFFFSRLSPDYALPAGLGLDLVKFGKLISGSSSLICSERFKEMAKDFKGINYTPLDTVLWSGIRAI